jgi:hypothetical protein
LDRGEGNKLSRRQLLLQGSRQGQFCKCCHSIVFFLEGPNQFLSLVFLDVVVLDEVSSRSQLNWRWNERRAGNAEVVRIHRDPRLTSLP